MSIDFRKVLSQPVADIKRPPLIPSGTYRARVSKPASFEEIANGRFQTIDFQFQLVEAQPDVSQDDLTAYGGLGPLASLRHRFMFDATDEPEAAAKVERTKFNLKTFLVDHLMLQGDNLNELIAQAHGNECLVVVGWRPDPQNPEIQYNDIKKTAPLPQ